MTPDNVNLEELKKAWAAMGESLGITPPPPNPVNLDNKLTALDRLRRKYKMFWLIALLMIFTSFQIFSSGAVVESRWNFTLGTCFAIYFLTSFLMDQWLWHGLGTIDPLRMTVAQVAQKSLYYRKRHIQFMAILIPMAIALLGFMAYVFSSDKYLLAGMITGAVVGGAIGIMQFFKFMDYYRQLSE